MNRAEADAFNKQRAYSLDKQKLEQDRLKADALAEYRAAQIEAEQGRLGVDRSKASLQRKKAINTILSDMLVKPSVKRLQLQNLGLSDEEINQLIPGGEG